MLMTPPLFNPFRTAVPLWDQTTWDLNGFSQKRDCNPNSPIKVKLEL